MLQDLLYDEFESNSSPGKEILRENGIVIQFLKAYLSIPPFFCFLRKKNDSVFFVHNFLTYPVEIAGKEYLLHVFKDIVEQICVTEKKVSYEIDPK